ncbi:DNA-3-methyladenine glycosylase 2 family protein [Candidatus Microgenomates bacterium]|nr:DNA-3-methyladenine glycosylase 2 family protein [Candidatus Microgenomates bacterium]
MSSRYHDHFKERDAILYEHIRRFELPALEVPTNLFERLCRSIIGQQLSVKAAATIFSRLVTKSADASLAPDFILDLSAEELRACGISYAKIKSLKDLAQKVKSGVLDLEKLKTLEEEEVINALCTVHGIGRWTAEMFLLFSLGREDVFSHGDLGLKRAIQMIYGFKKPPTQKQVEKIIKRWSPYKSFASRVLWRSLDNEPDKK